MTHALTETTWLTVLERIIEDSPSDTARTLAKMLSEIIYACNDRDDLAQILDTYGSKMLEQR